MFAFAILRPHSTKRSASGVGVRSFTVTSPTGAGGDNALIGRTLMPSRLPPNRMVEVGTRPSQRPISIKRMKRWSNTVKALADGMSTPLLRNTWCRTVI